MICDDIDHALKMQGMEPQYGLQVPRRLPIFLSSSSDFTDYSVIYSYWISSLSVVKENGDELSKDLFCEQFYPRVL